MDGMGDMGDMGDDNDSDDSDDDGKLPFFFSNELFAVSKVIDDCILSS